MAVYTDVLQVGPCGSEGLGCGDPGAGADRAVSGKGPTIFVGVEGDLHEHGKGVAALAGVEVVDLVAECHRHFGVDDLLGALEGELASSKDGGHFISLPGPKTSRGQAGDSKDPPGGMAREPEATC